jgi:hypothetical protein
MIMKLKTIKKTILTILFFLSSTVILAQTATTPKSSSNETIDVFDTGKKQDLPHRGAYVNNIIKLNPALVINGDFPIIYERIVSRKISFEIGAGLTTRNYFDVTKYLRNYTPDIIGFEYKETSGYSLRGAIKLYLSKDDKAPNGFYISPELLYRVYNRNSPLHDPTTGNAIEGSEVKTFTKNMDFKIVLGNQFCMAKGFAFEYYAGFGVGTRTYTFVQAIPYTDDTTYTDSFGSKSDLVPVFTLGIKLGFGF